MLLSLEPLTFIFFTITEYVDTISLTVSFDILALIHITVFVCGFSLSMWFS